MFSCHSHKEIKSLIEILCKENSNEDKLRLSDEEMLCVQY